MQVAGIAFAFGQIAMRLEAKHPSIHDRSVFALLALGGVLCAGSFTVLYSEPLISEISSVQWQSIIYLASLLRDLAFFCGTRVRAKQIQEFSPHLITLLFLWLSSYPCLFGEIASVSMEAIFRLLIGGSLIPLAVWIAILEARFV